MSGNHYSKQVLQLEAILRNRIAQLTVLETENARLKQKEYALQSCILGIENSVAATRTVLAVEAESAGADGNGNTHQSGDTDSQSTASGNVERAAAGTSVSKHSSGSAGSAAQAVLQALEAKEQQVQAALSQLGCCGSSYSEMYSARLLRRATADPAHALAIVGMTRAERLQFLIRMVRKMGLLLPKYDSSAPTTSLGSPKEQLHAVVDELSERILVAGLLDPPAKKLGNMLVNLETMQPEPYPEGYWKPVAVSLQLTDDQKAALKMCWARVKANKAALTEEHSTLSERLQLLQLRQQQVQLEFEEQAAQLHDLQFPYGVQQKRRFQESAFQQQQQQQQRASQQQELHHNSASQQPQHTSSVGMLQPSGAALQQQQQQPVSLPNDHQQQQQQVVYIPVLTGIQHQAADAGLQQLQPVGVLLQQQASPELLQQPSGPMSRGADGIFVCSTTNTGTVREVQPQQLTPSAAMSATAPSAAMNATVAPAAAAAAAAAAPASLCLPAGSCNAPGAMATSPEVSGNLTDMAETALRSSFGSGLSNSVGMLLPVASKEQRDIEQQLAVITEKLKMQHFCQSLQFHNVLTYKQIAEVYVNAWPFVPDALSVCEALDDLSW